MIEDGKRFGEITDFISDSECDAVREQVIELKDKWRAIYPSDHLFGPVKGLLVKLAGAGLGFYHLGDAVYIMKCDRKTAQDVDQEVKAELMSRFGWLFNRICAVVAAQTGVPTELHGITSPGFHISTVPFDINGAAALHEDFSITLFEPDVDPESIVSLIVLIDEPSIGAWLEWEHPVTKELKRYDYKFGSLHAWRGGLRHRVGSYETKVGEHRITLQCHYYFDKDKGCNRIYF